MMSDTFFADITLWIRVHLDLERSICHCGRDQRKMDVWGYPHEGGWETDHGRYWLFTKCKCGYEMALWKMGVPRDMDFRNTWGKIGVTGVIPPADPGLFLGRRYCEARKCPHLIKAPCPPYQKRTRKVVCEITGYMPGHIKYCPEAVPE